MWAGCAARGDGTLLCPSVLIIGLLPLPPGAVTLASKPRQVLFHKYFLISHSLPTYFPLLPPSSKIHGLSKLFVPESPPGSQLPACLPQLLTHHLAGPYKASFTSAASKDGNLATASVSCKVSLLPLHLSPSFLTYYLVTKKPLGETCYYSFLGVTQSQRQFSREMGLSRPVPRNGKRRELDLYSHPTGSKYPFYLP